MSESLGLEDLFYPDDWERIAREVRQVDYRMVPVVPRLQELVHFYV